MDVACLPIISAVVYMVVDVTKTAVGDNEKFKRFIPLLSFIIGVSLALALYIGGNPIIQANDAITAIIIGGTSGFSATGVNQASKYSKKGGQRK